MVDGPLFARGRAGAEEAVRNRVDARRVELVELVLVVDQHEALVRALGDGVVAHGVVGEVVDDLEREEPARLGHVSVPVEDGALDDLDARRVAAARDGRHQLRLLLRRESRGDLDDLVARARVHVRVGGADVVEDVEHQCAVARARLVDDQIVVRVVR